jgi:Putative ABC exporter
VSGLRALAYADVRSLVNAIALLRRRPWRALLWMVWIVAILGFGWLRTSHPALRSRPAPAELALQDLWICGATATFGFVLAFGAPHWTGFFASRAEALLLVRAPLPPVIVAGYLQVRTAGVALVQGFGRFAYVILVALPVHTDALGLAREMLLLAAAVFAILSVVLPRALARGPWRRSCVLAGIAVVALSLVPLLRDALLLLVRSPAATALAHQLPPWHPGLVFENVARGDLAPVGLTLLVALAAGTTFAIAARDAYPELYADSVARLEFRARLQRRDHAAPYTGVRAPSTIHVPAAMSGALALVWLEARTWSRSGSPKTTALLAAFAIVVGTGLAMLQRTQEPGLATTVVFIVLANLTIAFASATGVRLAADLRRPLFWLGDASLLSRLGAWTYASLWRDAVFFLFIAGGYVALAHQWAAALGVLVVTLGLMILTRGIGVAVFAVLPNALDQRGPAVGLRVLLAYALVTPPLIPAIIIGVLTRSSATGALAGLVGAIAEAVLLLVFAAWRLAGRVDRLTTAA